MKSQKCQLVEQYRKVRNMQRSCIVLEVTKSQNEKVDKQLVPLRNLIDGINKKINELTSERYKAENQIGDIERKFKSDVYSHCPEKQPKELAKFDRETEQNILDFLNGKIDKLE